jgi:hypothetical protein
MVGVCCIAAHPRLEVPGEHGGPRLTERGAGHARSVRFAIEEEPGEEALVGQASDARAAESVDLIHPLEQVEATLEGALDVLVDHLGCFEDPFGLVEVALNAILLLAGEIVRYGAGDDSTGQATALLGELFDALTGAADLGLGSFMLGGPDERMSLRHIPRT